MPLRPWLVVALLTASGCRSSHGSSGDVDGRALFQTACARCHGTGGHADTPQGQLLGAKDLTRDEVRRMSDAEIGHQIVAGKGRMPAFGQVLSKEEIEALVKEVRKLQQPSK